MIVVVTGAAGFIGSAVCRRLLADGHSVRGIDALQGGPETRAAQDRRIGELRRHPRFSFVCRDLSVARLDDLLAGADVMVHEAAMTGTAVGWTARRRYRRHNVTVVRRLLAQLVRHPGVHLVHASTSSVYGAVAIGDETAPLRPVSAYGVTKLAGERLVTDARLRYGVSATILRYFSVYGPDQRPDMAFSIITRRLLHGLPVTVTGDGLQSRSNTYIDDVVDATVRACELRPDGAILNICGGEVMTLLGAIDTLASALVTAPAIATVPPTAPAPATATAPAIATVTAPAPAAVIQFGPARPGDQRETRGDATRAREVLGWEPATPIAVGLARQAEAALVAASSCTRAAHSG